MTTASSHTPTAMTDALPLTPVDENWETALAVVAHPDDLEYGAAGAIARWTRQGKKITYCMVTSGEAGIDSMLPADAGPCANRNSERPPR
jgi:hypothetical protein